jgi:molecular chaperone GrpE
MSGKDNEKKSKFQVIDRRFWAKKDKGTDNSQEPDNSRDGANTQSKPTYIAKLEEELAQKENKLLKYIEKHEKSLSEFETARLRIQREVSKEVETNRREMLLEFLDILDNLDRALLSIDPKERSLPITKGIEMVHTLFVNKLASFGVVRIDALGKRFDPNKHEALSVVSTSNLTMTGQVVSVSRHGYAIGDEILRPAGVTVAQQR